MSRRVDRRTDDEPGGRAAGAPSVARVEPVDDLATAGLPLTVSEQHLDEMIAHCLRCYPEEGCGLIAGDPDRGLVTTVYPARNAAASAVLYTVDPRDYLRADRDAEDQGNTIIGVFHSHTHTDPYPSPTDVRDAPDPSWHYVLVSLRHEVPATRSYRIVDGNITEEFVVVLR